MLLCVLSVCVCVCVCVCHYTTAIEFILLCVIVQILTWFTANAWLLQWYSVQQHQHALWSQNTSGFTSYSLIRSFFEAPTCLSFVKLIPSFAYYTMSANVVMVWFAYFEAISFTFVGTGSRLISSYWGMALTFFFYKMPYFNRGRRASYLKSFCSLCSPVDSRGEWGKVSQWVKWANPINKSSHVSAN